jgi:TetR/AcrR family transcriptional repressor of nem operon
MSEPNTRDQLLDVAQELVQLRGYNGFSFYDLAERVGIKTASIHYHFPTKGDLGLALIKRHRQEMAEAFAQLEADEPDPWLRLQRYTGFFRATLEDGHRMCLGGILAVEHKCLPDELVAEVRRFFEDNERWLASTLKSGQEAGRIALARPEAEVARALFAALEGAMVSACAFGDFDRFDAAAAWHLANLKA